MKLLKQIKYSNIFRIKAIPKPNLKTLLGTLRYFISKHNNTRNRVMRGKKVKKSIFKLIFLKISFPNFYKIFKTSCF